MYTAFKNWYMWKTSIIYLPQYEIEAITEIPEKPLRRYIVLI